MNTTERLALFEAALNEVGIAVTHTKVWPDKTFTYGTNPVSPRMEYRAAALVRQASGWRRPVVCFDCWRAAGRNTETDTCRRVAPIDALRFESCGAPS
jgi:hypothetical protein